jgi:glyceraldehyde 3-phosphate dehydrogenase
MVKVAVNGFGRIGRLVFRFAWEDPTLELVHLNDLYFCESAAYLLKYDSVHGTWDRDVKVLEGGDAFSVVEDNGACTYVSFTREKDYTNIDFRSMGVKMVLECTGKFYTVKSLSPYFDLLGCSTCSRICTCQGGRCSQLDAIIIYKRKMQNS